MPPKREPPADDLFIPDDNDADYLDELSADSDEEDIKPSDKMKMALKGALQAPRHENWSAITIHNQIHFGQVELNPSFQRDVVWSGLKMMGLIQSMFMNYYIPPIIFSHTVDENGQDQYICIDGKQRCSSLMAFMDGTIAFQSPKTREKYWYANYGQQKRGLQLPDILKRKFENLQLQVVVYENLKDEQMRDIFQRVQMGMPLTAAEKMAAIASPWSTWIVELEKKYFTGERTMGETLDFDTKRGRVFQSFASFIILAIEWPNKQSTVTSTAITNFLSRSDGPDRNFKTKVEMTLAILVDIAGNYHHMSFGVSAARVAPVELWFSCLLVFSRMGIMSVPTLARQIGAMRSYIRGVHRDIRTNTATVKDMFYFLHNQVPKRKANGEVPAAAEFEGDEVDPREARAAKRQRQSEEQDPTYRGTAVPRGTESALGGTRQTKAAQQAQTRGAQPNGAAAGGRLSRPQVAPPPAVRPPQSAMERGAPAAYANPNFGQRPVQGQAPVNPYGAQGQPNGNQYNPHTASQIQHFSAMAQNAGPRWGTR